MINLPTIIVAALIAVVVIAIIVVGIRNKKKGKHSCSCGGNCGACNACQPKDGNSENNT